MKKHIILIIFILPLFVSIPHLYADGSGKVREYCLGKLDMEKIIVCTLDHSPEYKMSKYELEAGWGKRKVEEYLFPSNPTLSVMSANRRIEEGRFPPTGSQSVINGEILFSQEIYIGGQRQARLEMVDNELKSALLRIQAVERMTIHDAIRTTYLFQVSLEEYELSEEYLSLSQKMSVVAKKRLQVGLGTEMDSELAIAEYIQAKSNLESLKRIKESYLTDLVVMMGIPFTGKDDLFPREIILPKNMLTNRNLYVEAAIRNRPDLEALEWDRRVAQSRVNVLERERIPNLTVSGFVQSDGLNERVFGARVSLPIPVVRNKSGEIREAESMTRFQESKKEVGEHTVRSEAIKAWNELQSWELIIKEFSSDSMIKAKENLKILSNAVEKGDISVREAILLQRPFLDHRIRYIQTKRGHALALVEYLRAGGIPYSEFLRKENNEK